LKHRLKQHENGIWPPLGIEKKDYFTMRRIPIDELQEGMVLAKPLMRDTMIILGEGVVLTEAWISRIEDMGITTVFIEGSAEQVIPKEEALSQLNRRFQHLSDQPHMMALKKIVKEHIEGLYA
jgi:hypothetical protein